MKQPGRNIARKIRAQRASEIGPILLGATAMLFAAFLLTVPPAHADLLSDLLIKYRQFSSDRLIARIATPRALSWEHLSNFRDIVRLHVETDTWNEPVKINEPYNGHGTYLYITKASLSHELPHEYRGNCTALLGTKVIICDGAFLTNVGRCLQDPNVTVANDKDADSQTRKVVLGLMHQKSSALVSWVIGHEIGHIAKGHIQTPSQGGWSLPNSSDNRILGSRTEIEADEYSLRSMFRSRDEATRSFMGFFNQTIGLLTWHLAYDEGNKVFFNPDGHPPMAARLYNAWALYKRDYDPITE